MASFRRQISSLKIALANIPLHDLPILKWTKVTLPMTSHIFLRIFEFICLFLKKWPLAANMPCVLINRSNIVLEVWKLQRMDTLHSHCNIYLSRTIIKYYFLMANFFDAREILNFERILTCIVKECWLTECDINVLPFHERISLIFAVKQFSRINGKGEIPSIDLCIKD